MFSTQHHARRILANAYDLHAYSLFQRGGYDQQTIYWPGTPQQVSGKEILQALSYLASSLKKANLWESEGFIYPFAGPAGLLNLKALYANGDGQLIDNVLPQAGPLGYTVNPVGSGSSGGINTNYYTASGDLERNHLTVYLTANPSTATQVDIGCASTGRLFDLLTHLGGVAYFENSGGGMMSGPVNGPLGLTTGTRTSPSVATLYKNAVAIATSTQPNLGYPEQVDAVHIGFRRQYGDTYPSHATFAYASGSVEHGLSAAQQATRYQIIQHYQTLLKRTV